MTEYGRIHTDGSRSGGQPVQSDVERVARALAQVDGVEICSDATYALSSYGHKAQAALAAMRQPTQSKVAAACTDRIGGAGVVPHGVVGVATQSDALREENERLREHLISALDTLKDAEVCDDNCGPCNEARAALEQSK